ncbi:MAG: S-adenosylmethionine:tRNA ribosyltransferase-isomerase [Sediminibacterium sp.]|nr:S-adenosylmethionine:tRNA ribosyltransferase-isomerase [Sediminibacterium sp.]MBX9780113.1 S-adenosylmethionine:tRNA ribosyltransferase-isomerase [Chitinophagaceae bacterium]
MHPSQLSIQDFNYTLPEEKIARYPLVERDHSKLLIYKKGEIGDSTYRQIASYIPAESLLVFNNTKVVEARLLFTKESGGTIEIFCLEPDIQYPDITTAMNSKGKVWWTCLVGGAKKWKDRVLYKWITYQSKTILLSAKKIDHQQETYTIELTWDDADMSFAELLHASGLIPLPPYLNRKAEETDKERYQTIYAEADGSVAAPTAGLHFTESVFASFAEKNIQKTFVTLHVGAGTFKPVKAATMQDHEMHAEYIDVHKDCIQQLLAHLGKPIVAVGTTSLRTIESLYWLGVKTKINPAIQSAELFISQWEPYELTEKNISTKEALSALLTWMETQNCKRIITKTQIIIAPGYSFRLMNALVTNFHQPQSTLLLLVAAIVGDDWKKIYDHALKNDYRFLSYGDGSLLYSG